MKLSTKIFCALIGIVICTMIVATQVIWVSAKGSKNYTSTRIPAHGYRIIEIGNNWRVNIYNSLAAPVMTKYNDRDTLVRMYGIHIGHFDPDFIDQVLRSVVIENDTLKLKDLNHELSDCYIYLDTLTSEIRLTGSSQLILLGSSNRQSQFNHLKLRAFSHSEVFDFVNTGEIYGHDQAKITCSGDSSSINKIELHDYSQATINGSILLSNYSVNDKASLIFNNNFAASKTKRVNLKRDPSKIPHGTR